MLMPRVRSTLRNSPMLRALRDLCLGCLLVIAAALATVSHAQEESYPEHPGSVAQPGIPQGKIEGPISLKSSIFPGTVRDYWIYVPAQYDANKPAAVFV